MSSIPKPALTIGLLGVIPFVFSSTIQVFEVPQSHWLNLVFDKNKHDNILIFYSTIILSFMSGSFWALTLKSDSALQKKVYILSVAPSFIMFFFLSAHIIFLSNNMSYSFIILILCFVGILMFDVYFWKLQLVPKWWLKLRLSLTPLVIVFLLVGLIN